jgi:hypothetical protein
MDEKAGQKGRGAGGGGAPNAAREARLAKALRDNLRRRKQAGAAAKAATDPDAPPRLNALSDD